MLLRDKRRRLTRSETNLVTDSLMSAFSPLSMAAELCLLFDELLSSALSLLKQFARPLTSRRRIGRWRRTRTGCGLIRRRGCRCAPSHPGGGQARRGGEGCSLGSCRCRSQCSCSLSCSGAARRARTGRPCRTAGKAAGTAGAHLPPSHLLSPPISLPPYLLPILTTSSEIAAAKGSASWPCRRVAACSRLTPPR